MFILLNKCYGKFILSKDFLKEYPEYELNRNEWNDIPFRADKELIERVRNFGLQRAGSCFTNLSIVSIPNDVTDWRLREDDGYEYIEYVKDGKIFDA